MCRYSNTRKKAYKLKLHIVFTQITFWHELETFGTAECGEVHSFRTGVLLVLKWSVHLTIETYDDVTLPIAVHSDQKCCMYI